MKFVKAAKVFLLASVLAAVFAFTGAEAGEVATYQSLFISAEWVKANLGSVVLIDARTGAPQSGCRIPGAVNADLTYFANMEGRVGDPAYGAVLDPAAMARRIGALGIDGRKDVVVYGDGGDWGNAGWIVWALRLYGVRNARILDGGFTVYRASGGKTSGEAVVNPAVYYSVIFDGSYIAGTAWMKENYNNPEVKVVDVRSFDEYTGKVRPFGERRPGHIPGAINLPWDSVYTNDFKVLQETALAAVFEKAGLTDKNQTIVCYDTSGVRAAFMTMMLRMAGYPNAACYNPSYQAWCADSETEIVQGPNPL